MLLNIYCIFDEKAGAYAPPIFLQKDGMALRAFEDEVNNDRSRIHAHPEDYSLYKLGSFNDESGKIDSNIPEFMVKGSSVLKGV